MSWSRGTLMFVWWYILNTFEYHTHILVDFKIEEGHLFFLCFFNLDRLIWPSKQAASLGFFLLILYLITDLILHILLTTATNSVLALITVQTHPFVLLTFTQFASASWIKISFYLSLLSPEGQHRPYRNDRKINVCSFLIVFSSFDFRIWTEGILL